MEIFAKCIGVFVMVAALIFFIMTVVGLFIRDVIRPKDGPLIGEMFNVERMFCLEYYRWEKMHFSINFFILCRSFF